LQFHAGRLRTGCLLGRTSHVVLSTRRDMMGAIYYELESKGILHDCGMGLCRFEALDTHGSTTVSELRLRSGGRLRLGRSRLLQPRFCYAAPACESLLRPGRSLP